MTRTWTTRDQDLLALEGYPSIPYPRCRARARVAKFTARVIRIDFLPSFILMFSALRRREEACLAGAKETIKPERDRQGPWKTSCTYITKYTHPPSPQEDVRLGVGAKLPGEGWWGPSTTRWGFLRESSSPNRQGSRGRGCGQETQV